MVPLPVPPPFLGLLTHTGNPVGSPARGHYLSPYSRLRSARRLSDITSFEGIFPPFCFLRVEVAGLSLPIGHFKQPRNSTDISFPILFPHAAQSRKRMGSETLYHQPDSSGSIVSTADGHQPAGRRIRSRFSCISLTRDMSFKFRRAVARSCWTW